MRAGSSQLSWREQKRAALLLDLTWAAVELFKAQGFDGTTAEQIAARAGTSPATFFRYFRTKEDVVFGNADERLQMLRAALAQADGSAAPVRVIEEMLTEQLVNFANFDEASLEKECLDLWYREPALRRRYVETILEWEGVLTEYLARAWDLPAEHPRCRLVPMLVIAVIREALESGGESREAARAAADRGFALLNAGLDDGLPG